MHSLFRLSIMLASVAAGLWAVNEYGPPGALQSVARRGINLIHQWTAPPDAGDEGAVPPNPRVAPPVTPQPSPITAENPLPLATQDAPSSPFAVGSLRLEDRPDEPAAPSLVEQSTDDPLAATLARLEARGATQLSISAWGLSSRLQRASCELPLAGRSAMTRHFEAVATDSSAAAADVLRQVEAWQRPGNSLAAAH